MPGPAFAGQGKMGNLGRMIKSYSQRLIMLQQKRSSSSFYGRPLSSGLSEPARRNSSWASSQPCLVLPPDFARGMVEDDKKDDEKEKDKYYYCYYSLGEKKVLGVKDDYHNDTADNLCSNSSRKRGVLLPWEKELLLPRDAICVGSSHGWLAYVNTREDCSLYLFKHPPLSSPDFFASGMFRLPPLQTLNRISAVVTRRAAAVTDRPPPPGSHCEQHVHPAAAAAVTREYMCWDTGLEGDISDDECHSMPHARSPYFITEDFVEKIVLSSAPSPSPSQSLAPVIDTAGCIALALIPRHKLAFCRLGDQEWTPLNASSQYHSDLIYSTKNKCFCALRHQSAGHFDCIDLSDPSSPKTYILQPSGAKTRRSYDLEHLVESSGEILLIQANIRRRRPDHPYDLRVFKLDHVQQAWESVKSIGDHALFVGPNHSFSLSTLDFPRLKPNSIYFIDTTRIESSAYDPANADTFRHHNIGVFGIQDKSFEQLHPFDAAQFIYPFCPFPLWVAPSPSTIN